jgi:beta-mannosidase
VQDDLLRAGLISDWNVGLNAPLCEWVEHRHWEYRCEIEVPADWAGQRIILRAEGLDYSGHILVDGKATCAFRGMLRPHEFDLSGALRPGQRHCLSIIFEEAPHEQGQIGYTSRSRFFKARYAYGWDWCPRMVPLGIWDRLTLMTLGPTRLRGCLPYAQFEASSRKGALSFRLDVESPEPAARVCRVTVRDGQRVIREEALRCAFGPGRSETQLSLSEPLDVEPWWPNGLGGHKLYEVTVQLEAEAGRVQDAWQGHVGFRQVRWLPCEGAPANAEPWICEVNGKAIFLQGVNWVPPRMTYGSVTHEMYAERLSLYADMGCNILRVWGGSIPEKEEFYDLCDELGLLVWQEFPLSSSGAENAPPSDPIALADLSEIAASYIWRRGGHASLLLWCGGNELTWQDRRITPVDEVHPAIAALAAVAARLSPDTRFLSTSSSGPSFSFDPAQAGKGLHHDTHGPWENRGTFEEWKAHWDQHDALFVSEVGAPSASPVEVLRRYSGGMALWPPSIDNPFWRYRSPWWVQWDYLAERHGFRVDREELERFVAVSQEEQARALAYMAASCKRRFPRCGGVILWMGHDIYPCSSNTAIVDFDGKPKPAAQALKAVFRG